MFFFFIKNSEKWQRATFDLEVLYPKFWVSPLRNCILMTSSVVNQPKCSWTFQIVFGTTLNFSCNEIYQTKSIVVCRHLSRPHHMIANVSCLAPPDSNLFSRYMFIIRYIPILLHIALGMYFILVHCIQSLYLQLM